MAQIFNVKDYGAAGDWATDDTQAIQAAIDAAAAAGGGTVYVPTGDYVLSKQGGGVVLDVKANVTLAGQDPYQTRLWLDTEHSTGDIDAIVRLSGDNTSAFNLGIDAGLPTGVVNGWAVGDGVKATLHNVSIANTTGIGFDLRAQGSEVTLSNADSLGSQRGGVIAEGLVNSRISDSSFSDNGGDGVRVTGPVELAGIVSLSNFGNGFVLRGDAQGNAPTLVASSASGNFQDGVRVENATGVVLDHLLAEDNDRAGVSLQNAEGTQITASSISGNAQSTASAELVLADSHGTRIEGNRFGGQTDGANGAIKGQAVEERGGSDANIVGGNLISSTYETGTQLLGGTSAAFDNTHTQVSYGSTGDDRISTGEGAYNHEVYGGAGNDTLYGGVLDDTLVGGAGADQLISGKGDDTFRFTSIGDSYRSASGQWADTLGDFDVRHDSLDLTSLGLTGLGDGHQGTVALRYDASQNLTYLENFDANAQGQHFALMLKGDYRSTLTDANFLPIVQGTAGDDTLHGTTQGRDTLLGGNGDDALYGRGSDDRLEGGKGADRLVGDAGADTFVYSRLSDSQVDAAGKGIGRDLIVDFNAADGDLIDVSALGFTGLGDGRGATLAVSYDSRHDVTRLSAWEQDEAGNHFQVALKGNHLLDLSPNSIRFSAPATDHVTTPYSNEPVYITGTDRSDTIIGSNAWQYIDAGAGNDVVVGGANGDYITGGLGADRLTGGAGRDTFVYHSVEDSYRTADKSHSDLITDFDTGTDSLQVRDLGYTGIGNGFNGTLKIDYNAALDRTYVRDLEGDGQGRFFQIALSGDQTSNLSEANIGFARTAVADDAIEVLGVATATVADHAV